MSARQLYRRIRHPIGRRDERGQRSRLERRRRAGAYARLRPQSGIGWLDRRPFTSTTPTASRDMKGFRQRVVSGTIYQNVAAPVLIPSSNSKSSSLALETKTERATSSPRRKRATLAPPRRRPVSHQRAPRKRHLPPPHRTLSTHGVSQCPVKMALRRHTPARRTQARRA